MQIKIHDWRISERNSEIAVFSVELSHGLIIPNFQLHGEEDGARITFPMRETTDDNGDTDHTAVIGFSTPEAAEQFTAAVLVALKDYLDARQMQTSEVEA